MDKQFLNDRLSFFFMHTKTTNNLLRIQGFNVEEKANIISIMLLSGVKNILEEPSRGVKISLTDKHDTIGEMIIEDFNMLDEWCVKQQDSGLPITIIISKIELEIMNCMEKLTDKVIREVNQ
jgi:hypothetical protein